MVWSVRCWSQPATSTVVSNTRPTALCPLLPCLSRSGGVPNRIGSSIDGTVRAVSRWLFCPVLFCSVLFCYCQGTRPALHQANQIHPSAGSGSPSCVAAVGAGEVCIPHRLGRGTHQTCLPVQCSCLSLITISSLISDVSNRGTPGRFLQAPPYLPYSGHRRVFCCKSPCWPL